MAGGLLVTVLLVVPMCLQHSLQVHPPLKNIVLRNAQRKRPGIRALFHTRGNFSDWGRHGVKGDCFFASRDGRTAPKLGLILMRMSTIQKITVHACENDVDSLRGVEVSIGRTRVGLFPSNRAPALVTSFTDHLPMQGRTIAVEKTRGVGEYVVLADLEVWAYQCDDARYYGDLCDQPCGSGCIGGTCDSLTGICTPHSSPTCKPGYKSLYMCDQVCDKGSYGSNCEEMCGHGCLDGACNNTNGHCQCLKRWMGPKCDAVDVCQFDPCENGGRCQGGLNYYTCVCLPGFTGLHCEQDIDDCQSNPCGKGSHCSDGVNSYTCQCPPGFSGHRCEQDIDDCWSSPCENGGQCQDGINSYTCQCPPGYTGHLCEQAVDVCQFNPCDNGGRCQGGLNLYTCVCPPGFTGHHCEQGCEAGRYGYHCSGLCGRCRDSDQCDVITGDCPAGCEDGFHGTHCDHADDSTKFYIVVGVAAMVIALVAVVSVLLYRSRRAGQVPRTGGDRTEYLGLEEAGTQDRSPEQEMDSNRPTLPGEEEGVYSDITSSTGFPSAGARAKVSLLQPQHCHQEKTGEKAAAMSQDPAIIPEKGPPQQNPLKAAYWQRNPAHVLDAYTCLTSDTDSAASLVPSPPLQKMSRHGPERPTEETAQALIPSFELASIFASHPAERLDADNTSGGVQVPTRTLASYDRSGIYKNTTEDAQPYKNL